MLDFPSYSAGEKTIFINHNEKKKTSENGFKMLSLQISQTRCFLELVNHRLTRPSPADLADAG